MKIGMVGLGKMGLNMAKRLLSAGHQVVGFDLSDAARKELAASGGEQASDLASLASSLDAPRVVWLMLPSGGPTTGAISELAGILSAGDVVVDGGNSHYKDSLRHAEILSSKSIRFLDAGTSGGIWGLSEGYCLMVGGDAETFAIVEPALKALAPEGGYRHVGPTGAGHFVKMVHNGIEYGMMQAYAEGFSVMAAASEFGIDLAAVAELWLRGSVVRSWLLELLARALASPDFAEIEPWVEDTGEGRWTALEAIDRGVPAPAMTTALYERFSSRGQGALAYRILAALRHQFGGHPVKRKDEGGPRPS